MFKLLLRGPFTIFSLMGEVNRNKHFSVAEKLQAFATLSALFLRQRFQSQQPGNIKLKIFNFRVVAFDFQTIIFLFREIFLSEVYYFETDNKNPVILDGGANIGVSSLYFKFLYPQCHIVAFEPNPNAADLFRQNISHNNLQHITLIPGGLGNKNGEMNFYLGENKDNLNASFLPFDTRKQLKIQVEKLSGYIKFYKPELVKLDVEGAETSIVQELREANALAIPKHYIIEYHPPEKNREAALANFVQVFTDAGFLTEIRKHKAAVTTEDQLFHFYR